MEEVEVCSICYYVPEEMEQAIVPQCNHYYWYGGYGYVVSCLLSWSTVKSLCPLCKQDFSSLLEIKQNSADDILDALATLTLDERVHSLHHPGIMSETYEDELEDSVWQDQDEEEAHMTNIAYVGNRRHGPNGVIRSGHAYARPVNRSRNRGASSSASSSRASRKSKKGRGDIVL